uniref:Uncharacterized protein MANES_02G010800 n=1 Tax=Rhizophora mucronata TaxID=61149 RepID=A0A2P2J6M6_RHIMU
MIPTNKPNAKNMLIIIQQLQPLGTSRSWQSRLNIHFPKAANLKVTLHNAPTNKWLVLLRLIKSPHQRPYQMKRRFDVFNERGATLIDLNLVLVVPFDVLLFHLATTGKSGDSVVVGRSVQHASPTAAAAPMAKWSRASHFIDFFFFI